MKKKRKEPSVSASDALLHAVGDFVTNCGGDVVVAGPVSLMRWPSDSIYHFTIAVKCTGRAPADLNRRIPRKKNRKLTKEERDNNKRAARAYDMYGGADG